MSNTGVFQLLLKIIFNYSQMEKLIKITPHNKVQVELQKTEIRIFTGSDGDNFQNTFISSPLY